MLKKVFYAALLFAFAISCGPQKQIEIKEIEIEKEDVPSKLLMHDVYFNLIDSISEADYKMVLAEMQRLAEIEETLWLHLGEKAETGDARLSTEYDLALHVVFTSEENLQQYAVNALHLQVKENIKPFIVAPPVVFDYWTTE